MPFLEGIGSEKLATDPPNSSARLAASSKKPMLRSKMTIHRYFRGGPGCLEKVAADPPKPFCPTGTDFRGTKAI